MKIVKYFMLSAACVLSLQTLAAQDIRGKVTDNDGQPLAGASVYWAETTIGVGTDAEGAFKLHRVKGHDRLVASYLGYVNDTIRVESADEPVRFALEAEGVEVESVVVESTLGGNYVKRDGLLKGEMISFAGLCKMACCNLAESFENSASVTVGYSDAISGARQIKMLGLAGTYTQILDENRPIMRGLSAPYGLSYTPGMWLNSIQVSKGISSVTAGHDAVTGQINLEHRKPTDNERLFLNVYFDSELRPEVNLSSAIPLKKDKSLSTVILFHGSTDTKQHDMIRDGYRDLPLATQLNLANKWLWQAKNGLQLRWGWKVLGENRLGGQMGYKDSMREQMLSQMHDESVPYKIYGSKIANRTANAYVKLGMPVGRSVYDEDRDEELRSNFAMMVDYNWFRERAYFGANDYDGDEHAGMINVMYNHYFTPRHTLIAGIQGELHDYTESLDQRFYNEGYDLSRIEGEVGAYAEYTYSLREKLSVVVGMRGDYNFYYKKGYFTPRAHLKWNITPTTVLRGSAGMGYRSTNVITDNIGMLATGRRIVIPEKYITPERTMKNRMESAVTAGASLSQTFSTVLPEDLTISVDYFHTYFFNALYADQEVNATEVVIRDAGEAYSHNVQVDISWTPIERFDIFATFRYTDSRILKYEGCIGRMVERPLVSRFKGLLNLQYATPFRRWTFDFTAQLNGPSVLPQVQGVERKESPIYPMFYAQISYRIKMVDLYVGCENIAGYVQKNPILNGDTPFSPAFNSSVVWGPLMGRKFYIGMRFNLY